jgi:hypothetical protein
MEDVLIIRFQLNSILNENKSKILMVLKANEDHKYYSIKIYNFQVKIKCM